jgi:hypothetical protein
MSRSILAVFGIAVLALFAIRGEGQDRPASKSKDTVKRGAPGLEHERLQGPLGTWVVTTQPRKEKGTAEFKCIMGGRFVIEEVRIPSRGSSMEWHGTFGDDTYKKTHTAVKVDNIDTTTEVALGEVDATGKVYTFRGDHRNLFAAKMQPFTYRIALDSDTKMRTEMLEPDQDGTEKTTFVLLARNQVTFEKEEDSLVRSRSK